MKFRELTEQGDEPVFPTIEIKSVTKDMRFIFIDGEKAGSLHLGWESKFSGFNTWRKVHEWTGEFVFRGQTHHVSGAKISEMVGKVTRLVRRTIINPRNLDQPPT